MKILLLSKEFREGEPISEHVKELAESLAGKGHEPVIISFDDQSYYDINEDVKVKRVPLKFEGSNIYNWSMILNNELKREAKNIMDQEEEFDLIHAHDWTTTPGGVTLSKHIDKPLLLTLHSTENQRGFQAEYSDNVSELEYQGAQEAKHVLTTNQDTKNSILFDLSQDDDKVTVADPCKQNWAETVLNKYKETLKQEQKVENQ